MSPMSKMTCVYCQASIHGIDGFKVHLCELTSQPFADNIFMKDLIIVEFQLRYTGLQSTMIRATQKMSMTSSDRITAWLIHQRRVPRQRRHPCHGTWVLSTSAGSARTCSSVPRASGSTSPTGTATSMTTWRRTANSRPEPCCTPAPSAPRLRSTNVSASASHLE